MSILTHKTLIEIPLIFSNKIFKIQFSFYFLLNTKAMRARSLDPRGLYEFEKTNPNCKTPIFCNRYAIDEFNRELRGISLPNNRTYHDEFDDEDDEPRNQHPISRTGRRSMRQSTHQRPTGQRAQSMPRPYYQPTNEELEPSPSPPYRRNNNNHLCPPEPGYEMQPIRKHKRSPRNNRSCKN